MATQRVLVAGATGLVGLETCLRLARRGHAVRALVRSTSAPEKTARLREAGVELTAGDLKDPASLRTACDGMDAIVSTASATLSRQDGDSIASVDLVGQLNLVEAAKSAGVPRFVFVSFRRPTGAFYPLAEAKAAVEEAARQFDFTVIQASWFMEVWLSPAMGFDYANGTARIFGPGSSPVSWVSFADVAEMCAIAVGNPGASCRVIEFGGPEPISPIEVVRKFETIGGRPFQVEHVPQAALQAQYDAAEDPMQKSFAALMLGYSSGDAIDMDATIQEFGLDLKSVDGYARAVLGKIG